MTPTIRKILELLTPREKRTGLLVLSMVLVMALIETAGVASVMPFLAVLGNPSIVDTNQYLASLNAKLGFPSRQALLTTLGLVSFTIVVFGTLFRLATLYALLRWANMRRHSVSHRLLASYLRQPYEFFLNRNSADLSKTILSEVDELTGHVFQPGIQLIAYATAALTLVLFLVFVAPGIALIVILVLGGFYIPIYLGLRGVLERLGTDRASANRERFTAASEVLGGIKDIKVLGREDAFLAKFHGPSSRASRHQASIEVLSLVPKHAIEALGFGGVLALAVVLIATRGDLAATLPVLGVYALAGYRLLPSTQQIFASLAKLRFGKAAVDVVHADLMREPARDDSKNLPDDDPGRAGRLAIRDGIRLRGVGYTYPGAPSEALKDIDLEIPRHSSLGVVGTTGAGKTTFVDIVLGLLPPAHGEVLADGRSIREIGIRKWQNSIGYVPQHIYLADTTVAENIALGVDPRDIDRRQVMAAAGAAQIDEFVGALERGYDTMVGERGVRLSGGQRQRIGIARALYHDPELLVLDEATSSLDAGTEDRVMDAIASLRGSKTLIIIAHRLRTVEGCDRILVLEGGRIGGLGSYSELDRSNEAFRRVAVR